MTRKAVETKRSGTPLASASSGCRVAKISGRMIAARPSNRDHAEHDQRSDHRAVDREHVAEQQRRRLGGERRVVVQEQEPETERQRQHHADGDIALAQALAEHTHADAGRDGEADQPPHRSDADQHRAGRAGKADMRQRVAGEGLSAQHQEIADQPGDDRGDAGCGERVPHEIVVKHGDDDRADDRGRVPSSCA